MVDLLICPLPAPGLVLHQRFQDAFALLAILVVIEFETIADEEVPRVTVMLLDPPELLFRKRVICSVR